MDIQDKIKQLQESGDYNSQQLEIIKLGLENNINVSLYGNPECNAREMSIIYNFLLEESDVNFNPELYSYDQLVELILGHYKGVDVSKYSNPEYSSEQMRFLLELIEDGIDTADYSNPNLTVEEMWNKREECCGMEYNGNNFTYTQAKMINMGLEYGIDVSYYASVEFNRKQMSEILYGLLSNVDVSIYSKPEFNDKQMCQIRLGLESGEDVSEYTNPELDQYQMAQIRRTLMYKHND